MTFSSLTPEDRGIISRMRRVHFGQLDNLAVRNGHVVAMEGAEWKSKINFRTKNNLPHVATRKDGDFLLNDVQINFLETIHSLEDCMISFIKVSDGLPTEMELKGHLDHI